MPRITVLMPTFKQSAFIRRATDSLLVQSMDDWELIILDDGSPDETGRLLPPYLEDSRIQYRFNRPYPEPGSKPGYWPVLQGYGRAASQRIAGTRSQFTLMRM